MSDVYRALDAIERMVDGSPHLPLFKRFMVKEGDFFDLTRKLRQSLPSELRDAQELMTRREEVLAEAQQKADDIIARSKAEGRRLVDEHEVTLAAEAEASRILDQARDEAAEIRLAAQEWSYELFDRLSRKAEAVADALEKAKTRLRPEEDEGLEPSSEATAEEDNLEEED